jgi:hypothetical protein
MGYARDRFNRANATTLGNAETGQTWTTVSGSTYGVTGNRAYVVSPSTASFSTINDVPREMTVVDIGDMDQRIGCDIYTDPVSAHPGIVARYKDINNYIYVALVNTTVEQIDVYVRDTGTFTRIGGDTLATVNKGQTYRVQFNIGATLGEWELYVDDVLIDSNSLSGAARTALDGGTSCGLYLETGRFSGTQNNDTGGSRFDNFNANEARRPRRGLGLVR